MQVAVLGPVLVSRENVTIDLCAPKPRALLAALALQAGRPVAPARMIYLRWAVDRSGQLPLIEPLPVTDFSTWLGEPE